MSKKLKLTGLLLLIQVGVWAQTLPCANDDPDIGCPIDDWVIAYAIIIGVAVLCYLKIKQKRQASIKQLI